MGADFCLATTLFVSDRRDGTAWRVLIEGRDPVGREAVLRTLPKMKTARIAKVQTRRKGEDRFI